MNRLQVLAAGSRVPTRRFSGVVHSVFARACNIDTGDDRLLGLLAAEHGNSPNAISVQAPPGFAFDRLLRVGERAGCREGVLRAGSLGVDMRGAACWHGDVRGLRVDLRKPGTRSAWRVARRCLVTHPSTKESSDTQLPAACVRALWRAARAADIEGAARAVTSLAGCGPGLTPAGDDLLVGFLAGLHASAAGARRTAFVQALCEAARRACRRTNPISASYLLLAADGEVAERLATLAASIAAGANHDQVRRDTEAALAVGATSGADGVRGLLLGLAVLATSETPVECLT